jgi:hypothetical protein
MLNDAVPLPLPLAPPVTVIHAALLVADHPHPANVVTAADPVAVPALTDWLDGEIEYVHGAAACVTVYVCPAIVNVPIRCEAFGFAAMLNDAVPLPSPVVAPDSVIHAALLVADHAQPACAVTVEDPLAAAALVDWLDGEIEYVQDAAACVTV